MLEKDTIIKDVASYYSEKLAIHGETPRGVDWNGEESQNIRFEQLSKIITCESGFSVNDLGCGYGALQDYLAKHYRGYTYHGIDISEDMIQAAKERYSTTPHTYFVHAAEPQEVADYGIASGIFNVRLGATEEEWWTYIESTLNLLNRFSRNGFAFNCLTSYSDTDKMREGLFYLDPGRAFDFCKRTFSRNIALLHDYDLYEFTILVRK
ncbi:class I SAM-dependent methyltransferase [Pseudomonas sp. TE3610]